MFTQYFGNNFHRHPQKPQMPPRSGRGYARGCETVNLTHGYFAPALRVTPPASFGSEARYGVGQD